MCPLMICLHASEANSIVIDKAIQQLNIDVRHTVDAELIVRIRQGELKSQLLQRVHEQMNAIIEKQPDFILVTCTNYIALLDELEFTSTIPVLKLDELLFEQLIAVQKPIKILFTNESTIRRTMKRLYAYCQLEHDIEVIFIPHVFDWYLAGDILQHDQKIIETLLSLDPFENTVVVAQLSMAKVAAIYSRLAGEVVISPVTALRESLSNYFD